MNHCRIQHLFDHPFKLQIARVRAIPTYSDSTIRVNDTTTRLTIDSK